MELPVLLQAEQFAQALLLGGLLGLVYDLLRAPRRFLPKLGTMLDALFLLLLFLSLLGFALYAGQGQFRLFFFPGILLGLNWTISIAYFAEVGQGNFCLPA